MPTRFYLPYQDPTVPSITPTQSGSWEAARSPLARQLMRTYHFETDTTPFSYVFTDSDDTDKDCCIYQACSGLLTPGQTITGSQTIKLQVIATSDDADNDVYVSVGLRVMASDGTTVRKTLLDVTRDDTEIDTVSTNRSFSATSDAGDYTTVEGDVLVLEIGVGGNPQAGKSHTASLGLGSGSSSAGVTLTDLPEDDSDTTATKLPWLELADTLLVRSRPTQIYPFVGTWEYVAPYSEDATVECWAGGGGSGDGEADTGGGGGGGGGEYRAATVALTADTAYPVIVGAGGAPANSGNNSYFDGGGDCFAFGGSSGGWGGGGGLGGAGGTGGTGALDSAAGGAGGDGDIGAGDRTGGGGAESGGSTATGDAGDSGASGGGGGSGANTDGGDGGNGGQNTTGAAGGVPGGGGGGGGSDAGTGYAGGSGASGQVMVTMPEPAGGDIPIFMHHYKQLRAAS